MYKKNRKIYNKKINKLHISKIWKPILANSNTVMSLKKRKNFHFSKSMVIYLNLFLSKQQNFIMLK